MSLTRRDVLIGASGIIAASAAEAVSSESVIADSLKIAQAERQTSDDQKERTTTSDGKDRAFNGIYHGDYSKSDRVSDGWHWGWNDLPGRYGRPYKILFA